MISAEDNDLHAEIALLLEAVPAADQPRVLREVIEATGGLWQVPENPPATPHYQELVVGGIRTTGGTMSDCVTQYLAQVTGRAA
ncbi:hypothetical protein [Salipiger marinus]|uniref:Uncharacterized protein n=1 Tax=Salipiger marinus TaxID=555512 RepID=A0A1G8T688_9RHOB|nr:hypothetical protein [Salipiger marinus]SDJ36871.1 hypothetical protein SAMN04487993_102810 [Salipiger marinus]